MFKRHAEWVAVFILAFIGIYLLRDQLVFTVFQERDLERARMIANGHVILYGPEVTGGGHLPGPFYYLILAVPLALGTGWLGAWAMIALFGAASFTLIWTFFRSRFSPLAAFMGALSLAGLPMYARTLAFFQNFSLLPLLITVMMIGFALTFVRQEKDRAWAWYAACVAFGLALQTHMSCVFIFAAGPILQVIAPSLGLRRMPWSRFLVGAAAAAVTTLPYILWWTALRFGVELGTSPPRSVGSNLAGGVKFADSTLFTLDADGLRRVMYQLSQIANWMDEVALVVSAPMVVGLILGWWKFRHAEEQPPRDARDARSYLRVWAVATLCSMPPAISVLWTVHRPRYMVCFAMTLAFTFTAWLEFRLQRQPRLRGPMLVGTSAAAILLAGFIARDSDVYALTLRYVPWVWMALMFPLAGFALHLWRQDWLRTATVMGLAALSALAFQTRKQGTFEISTPPRAPHLEAAAKLIVAQTGWTWEQARERIYTVGFQYQRSMATIYREAAAAGGGPANVDGFFLVLTDRDSEYSALRWMLKRWPTFLLEARDDGRLMLQRGQAFDGGYLYPYRVTDPNRFPKNLHNIGLNYLDPSTVVQEDDPLARKLTFNECAQQESYCDIDFAFRREGGLLNVRITGDIISQTTPWASPSMAQSINEPFVQLTCLGKTSRTVLIPELGVTVEHVLQRTMNGNFLAPSVHSLVDPCPRSAIEIEAGYNFSVVTIGRNHLEQRPGKSAKLQLESTITR